MLLNYHEMTMDESRDSPSRNKQFKVICFVMIVCIAYSVISSGALRPVEIQEGVFPGGEFVHKYTGRDYAASMSLLDSIAKDLHVREKDYHQNLYNLYLDDPLVVNGRRQRFASGILLKEDTSITHSKQHTYQTNQERKMALLEMNESILEPTAEELAQLAAYDLWKRLKYQTTELPSAKAAVATYTFSNGFVSALLHSYKVFPALREQAKKNMPPGVMPVVLSTCGIEEGMCTHYVPYTDLETFRLGQPEQQGKLGEGLVNWNGVRNMLLKLVTLGKHKGDHASGDEL